MRTTKTSGQQLAGNTKANGNDGLERLLRATGDDPGTMIMLIELMDRMIAKRRSRRGRRKSTARH